MSLFSALIAWADFPLGTAILERKNSGFLT